MSEWDPVYGDRCQELVLIGIGMDEAALRARLQACLMTQEEMTRPASELAALADPFPVWGRPQHPG
ncbi:putative metal chaperone YciC [compost metagenome]